MRLTFIILLSAVYSCLAGPVYPQQELPKAQKLYITDDMKMAMVKDLQNEVVKVAVLKTLADSIKLEQAAEDKILEAAVETLEEEPSPERTEKLKEVEQLLKRDKRAVQILNGLLGGSSGGGGGGADASAGSDSGAILNLIGPLLGSSSGGAGGGGDGAGVSASAGSDSGSILNLITPLLGSSSGGSSGGDASGGSGLESILSLSSSSKGGGATAGGGVAVEAGAHGDSVLGQVKGAKFALVSDKIQLLMRVKFGLLSKILTTITNKIAQVSIPPHEQSIDNLKYPS
uniref:Keratin type i cytoskeletal 10-like protein n=2 Tax=Triatoma infestans TaxID=30076 RepID=A0A170ZSC8_TRIIF